MGIEETLARETVTTEIEMISGEVLGPQGSETKRISIEIEKRKKLE